MSVIIQACHDGFSYLISTFFCSRSSCLFKIKNYLLFTNVYLLRSKSVSDTTLTAPEVQVSVWWIYQISGRSVPVNDKCFVSTEIQRSIFFLTRKNASYQKDSWTQMVFLGRMKKISVTGMIYDQNSTMRDKIIFYTFLSSRKIC